MLALPQRNMLSIQVIDIVRAEIAAGRWRGWLPAERSLSSLLKVSRPTLRRALQTLVEEGFLEPIHGQGYRILRRPGRTPPGQRTTVHLLSPDPLEQSRHYSHLWIEELRFKLLGSGHELQLHHGIQYLRPGAERALARLVAQNPDGIWVLVHSSRVIQQWFTAQGIPALVVGYRHEGCDLPRIVVNMEAVCRHAAGEFIRLGHRQLALIRLKTDRAGDLQSERAFVEGARSASAGNVKVHLFQYEEDAPAAIARLMQRALRLAEPPTGILTAHASGYAMVATWLMDHGRRIPRDVSLMCREDDSFLRYLIPRPTNYQYSARSFAHKINGLVQQILRQRPRTNEIPITPEFVPGGSVGPPPGRGSSG